MRFGGRKGSQVKERNFTKVNWALDWSISYQTSYHYVYFETIYRKGEDCNWTLLEMSPI